ncbi:MAG: DUF4442 domain-containing protein [Bacteroidetes bacterium]|nr:DUF4442 domain-containing protein [Bacteroidota bacterium]
MPKSKFQKLVNNSFLFRLYLLKSLPMAFVAGIRVKELSDSKAITTIKFGWLTQNPFRSMYFACQAMAAEMSTGILVMNAINNSSSAISMLIIKNKANYFKKAVGKITFICADGELVSELIIKAKQSDEGVITDMKSIGIDESGDTVAEFIFTWSLKRKLK